MNDKKVKFQARQGDVLIEEIKALPAGLTKQKAVGGRVVVALGEATGHHHSLAANAADWWKDGAGEQFLDVKAATGLEHQEHGTIALPAGFKRVVRQREYSPEAIRPVMD